MNQQNLGRIYPITFLVSLLLLLSGGCATSQPPRVLGRHLENYRKVYLIRPTEDPREVIPRVLSRLQLAGFDASEISLNMAKALSQGAAQDGVNQPALLCHVRCVSLEEFPESWYSFQTIQIDFHDLEKGDLVFRASHFKYEPEVTENTQLNRLFVKISDGFFPGKPNPFIGKK